MTPAMTFLMLLLLTAAAFWLGRGRSLATVGGPGGIRDLHSLPSHYGMLTALWCGLPALLVALAWWGFQDQILVGIVTSHLPAAQRALPAGEFGLLINDMRNVISGSIQPSQVPLTTAAAAAEYLTLQNTARWSLALLVLVLGLVATLIVRSRIRPELRARNQVEAVVRGLLFVSSLIAVLTTLGIVLSVLTEALRFFAKVSPFEFLFTTAWSPQMAIREDQVGASGSFGAVPLFTGTLQIAFIAMLLAVPIGLMSAIYLAEYASRRLRKIVKPLLEVLAGVPTVVYGFFAATTLGPLLRQWGESLGFQVASESALNAGLVMGVMIIPFVSSLADDMITAVPQSLRDGAYALGATRSETIRQVVLRAALPGIVGGVLLAVSRAIGETMIVVMAAGLAANLTANPLEAVTTVTVQIVTLLVGDQEFDSPKTLAAFALGLVLFVVTLALNAIALYVVRRYREQYE